MKILVVLINLANGSQIEAYTSTPMLPELCTTMVHSIWQAKSPIVYTMQDGKEISALDADCLKP